MRPDLVIVAACGFDEERARADPVTMSCPVIVLDGHLNFSRPGPALMDSFALLSDAIAHYLRHAGLRKRAKIEGF
jgi:iron complex transport system substrate-binding protein